MKKFILFIIIINLFATTSHKVIVGYKKKILDTTNYFIPDFLKISTETSFVNIKIYEDTLTQKNLSASLNINIKLPEIFLKQTTTKSKEKKIENSSFTFKIRPFLRLKKNKIFFLQNIIEYQKSYLNNRFGISNKILFYPIDNYYEEAINFAYLKYLKHTYGINLNLYTNKSDFPKKSYFLNFTISNLSKKFIKSFGYSIGGSDKINPLIYYHKIYLNFRHTLFNKKYIFIETTPYILFSKEYNYKMKPALNTSINIKF